MYMLIVWIWVSYNRVFLEYTKVGNIAIFVQLPMEVKLNYLGAKPVPMQIYISRGALNLNWNDWFHFPTYFQI